jgi:hypothetical protein
MVFHALCPICLQYSDRVDAEGAYTHMEKQLRDFAQGALLTIEFTFVNDLVQHQNTLSNQLVLLALVVNSDSHIELTLEHIQPNLWVENRGHIAWSVTGN